MAQTRLYASITTTEQVVSVTAAPGSAGQAVPVTSASVAVILSNGNTGPVEFKIGAGEWQPLFQQSGVRLDLDLSTTAVYLRKGAPDPGPELVGVAIETVGTIQTAGGVPVTGASPVARWLQNFRGFGGVPSVMQTPPTITIGANNAVSTITGAANNVLTYPATDTRIGKTNGAWPAAADPAYRRPARAGGRLRFMTAANKFDLRLNSQDGYSGVSIKVYELGDDEGKYVSKGMWPAGQDVNGNHLVLVDFGDNVQSFMARVATRVAGGAGYAIGDLITLAGGTSTEAAVLRVSGVNAGAITNVSIKTRGVYSAIPAGAIAQASTTGAGTGATFSMIWNKTQTTVRERRYEIEFESNVWFGGLNLPSGFTAQAWGPSNRLPKLLTLSDSFGEGFYADYAAGSFSSLKAHMLGLSDNFERNGIAGRGWAKPGNNISTDMDGVIARAPDVLTINLSVNDPGFATAAEVQAAVTLQCNKALAALPNLRIVVSTGWDADTSYQNAVMNGVLAVSDHSRIRGINLQTNGVYVNTLWARSSDNTHPNQDGGADHLAMRLAALELQALQEMA